MRRSRDRREGVQTLPPAGGGKSRGPAGRGLTSSRKTTSNRVKPVPGLNIPNCDECHPYPSISFHFIRFNRHGNTNYFFVIFFIVTRERKDLQQSEPQRSVSALTAEHCSLLCPLISCLMWLECPSATFSVELKTHERLLRSTSTLALAVHSMSST